MSSLEVPISTSSEQAYRTPGYIYDHYARRFRYVVDLAASPANAKCTAFFTEKDNALVQDWAKTLGMFRNAPGPEIHTDPGTGERAAGWLNPPFAHAGRWAAKMTAEAARLEYGDVLTMLCLANSIGTEWYKEAAPYAFTEIITPRFTYVHPDPEAAALAWVEAGRKKGLDRRVEDWKPAAPSSSMVLLFSRMSYERRTSPSESLRIRHVTIREPKPLELL